MLATRKLDGLRKKSTSKGERGVSTKLNEGRSTERLQLLISAHILSDEIWHESFRFLSQQYRWVMALTQKFIKNKFIPLSKSAFNLPE